MTTEQTYSPPAWSMMAPVANAPAATSAGPSVTGSARAGGTPEEIEEQRRFAAAFARAQADAASRSAEPAPQAHTRLASSPEERMSNAAMAPPQDTAANNDFFGEDGFTLGDFVDIINPLQHLPVVSTVYRALTGDEISPGARLAGGTLYGGPIGLASAVANNVSEELTGQDVGGAVMTALTGGGGPEGGVDPLDSVALEDTADTVASLSPAAGPVAETPVDGDVSAAPVTTNASPIMAAQPPADGPVAPFAAIPNGSPLAVVQPPGIPLIQSNQPVVTPPPANTQTAEAPVVDSPAAVTAQGVQTLSPEVANVLLRMSQQSQAPVPPVVADVPAASVETEITPPPAPTATAPPPAVPDPSATAEAEGSDRTQVAGYIDPVSAEDLPSAMMDALLKYESMKQ